MQYVSEEDLVGQLKSKNERAFSHLYHAYAPALYGTIQRIIPCEASAQDVLQNVFIKIWSSGEQYHPSKGRLFTWMVTISRNASLDYLRHRQSRPQEYGTSEVPDIRQRSCAVKSRMQRLDVRSMIGILAAKERALMDLVLSGFTCKEISLLLTLPLSTVKTRLRVCYKKCRAASPVA